MHVPFIDLKAQYESIKYEINAAVQEVLESCAFAGGPFVEKFEREFAEYCQCKHCIGVGSGTEALWLSLLALGIGPGDDVITVPNTFIATAEAISFTGAAPVFVDVDEETYNINPNLIEEAITSKTKAIIPVHLYGQMADMDCIMTVAKKHNLYVVEDACQAHGAEYKRKRAGSIGDAGCFSFYPGKNLGAYGEAGAVVTNTTKIAKKIMMLRDHGQFKKYHHNMIGWNARMDGIQGSVLSTKLKYLDKWNVARRNNAKLYTELLTYSDDLVIPYETDYAKHVYHIYTIRVKNRNELMSTLAEKEIECRIHYPIPIYLHDAYGFLGLRKNSFPVTDNLAKELLSIPMFPELTKEQIEHVVNEIKLFIALKAMI